MMLWVVAVAAATVKEPLAIGLPRGHSDGIGIGWRCRHVGQNHIVDCSGLVERRADSDGVVADGGTAGRSSPAWRRCIFRDGQELHLRIVAGPILRQKIDSVGTVGQFSNREGLCDSTLYAYRPGESPPAGGFRTVLALIGAVAAGV